MSDLKPTVERCWASLKRQANKRTARGGLANPWAAVQFSRQELAAWLLEQSGEQKGQWWRCCYSGALLSGQEISIDHAEPRVLGGTTTLDNLRICSARMNRIKGNLTEQHFRAMLDWAKDLSRPERTDVMRRLGQAPNYRDWSRKGKALAGAQEDF